MPCSSCGRRSSERQPVVWSTEMNFEGPDFVEIVYHGYGGTHLVLSPNRLFTSYGLHQRGDVFKVHVNDQRSAPSLFELYVAPEVPQAAAPELLAVAEVAPEPDGQPVHLAADPEPVVSEPVAVVPADPTPVSDQVVEPMAEVEAEQVSPTEAP